MKHIFGILLLFCLAGLSQAQAATITCPGTPAALHCAQLSWTASVVDATHGAPTGYNVYRSTTPTGCATLSPTSTTCTKVGSSAGTATTFTDSPLVQSTTYFWVFTAFNANGESGPSNPAITGTTLTDAAVTIPNVPANATTVVTIK